MGIWGSERAKVPAGAKEPKGGEGIVNIDPILDINLDLSLTT